MGLLRYLATALDAAERSVGRRQLSYYGRAVNASEDYLVPQADLDTCRQRCKDLRRNNPIISGAIDRIVDNVVGSKITMQARTSSPAWNQQAEEWLDGWMAKTDPEGFTSFTDAGRLTVAARLYDGEIFHQPTPTGQLAIIEAERVRESQDPKQKTPVPGARLDPVTGAVTAWCVHSRDIYGQFGMKHAEQWVPGLIHCARRWRPDQRRGYPDLAVVANIVTDLNEINSANLRKSKMGALAAWVYEKATSGGSLQGRTTPESAGAQPLHKFQEGQIYEVPFGSKLSPFQNNQPGSEYQPFVELNLRLVGMALGLPYEFLLLYFGGGNFASSKASLLQAYKTIETWQAWLETSYIFPAVSWRVSKAIRDRELPPAPVDARGVSEWSKWEWQRPGVEWIDPQNAIQTEMQEVRIGASDMYAVCARRGRDAEETARANARYLKMLERVATEEGVDQAALHNIQIPGQTPPPAAATAKPKDGNNE